jgi:hypothetical protein
MAGYSFASPPRSTPQGSNGNYGYAGGTYPHHQQQYYGHQNQNQNQNHFAHQQNQHFTSWKWLQQQSGRRFWIHQFQLESEPSFVSTA